jgi:hypothetical protein
MQVMAVSKIMRVEEYDTRYLNVNSKEYEAL